MSNQNKLFSKICTAIKKIINNYKKNAGLYSANRVVVFSVLFMFFVSLFTGSKISKFANHIDNGYLRNIFIVSTQPIVDLSQNTGLDNVFSTGRKNILSIAKLNNNHHWDAFYYTGYSPLIVQTQVRQKENIKNNSTDAKTNKNDEVLNIINPLVSVPKKEAPKTDELVVVSYEYTRKRPLRILFVGDSLLECFSAGFSRIVGDDSPFEIDSYSVPSSGFIRTDYYNWPEKFKLIFEQSKENPYDCVVLIMGMNDYQNFFDGFGKLYKKGSEEWQNAYIEKMRVYLDILTSNVKKVYWLGLPVVKSNQLNEDIKIIEKTQVKAATMFNASGKIDKISIREIAPGLDVPYTPFIQTAEGEKIQMMRDDGTHFTVAGGEYIMNEVMKKFYSDFDIELTD